MVNWENHEEKLEYGRNYQSSKKGKRKYKSCKWCKEELIGIYNQVYCNKFCSEEYRKKKSSTIIFKRNKVRIEIAKYKCCICKKTATSFFDKRSYCKKCYGHKIKDRKSKIKERDRPSFIESLVIKHNLNRKI